MTRDWYEHRQAYAPRTWPVTIATAAVIASAVYLGTVSVWIAAPVGAVVGFLSAAGQWALWRRRHPIISVEEWARRRRENARWN